MVGASGQWVARELGSTGALGLGWSAQRHEGPWGQGQGAGEAADGVTFAGLWLFTSSSSHYLFNSGGGLMK